MSDSFIPLTPDTYVEGGGLIDDVDLRIVEARFKILNKLGDRVLDRPSLYLVVDKEPLGDGKGWQDVYASGDTKYFKPSRDGKNLVKVGEASGLRSNTRAAAYIAAAAKADPSIGKGLSDPSVGISVLDGRTAHERRVPAPKTKEGFGKADATILVIETFIKANGKARANGRAAAADTSEFTDEAVSTILGILSENEEGISKAKLSQALFKALDGNPNRKDIMNVALDPQFLKSGGDDSWTFDGKIVTAS